MLVLGCRFGSSLPSVEGEDDEGGGDGGDDQ